MSRKSTATSKTRGLKLLKPDAIAAKSKTLIAREASNKRWTQFFQFLAANPYILLFLTVGLAVWLGRQTVAGLRPRHGGGGHHHRLRPFGLGLGLRRRSSSSNNFTKSLFYYLFMYGVGLARRTVLRQQPRRRRFQVHLSGRSCPASSASFCVGPWREAFRPASRARPAACSAGSQTMSAAIGSAEQAVTPGRSRLPPGTTPEQVSAMIALSYGITYIWGTVGIILITQVPAAMVGRRRPGRGQASTREEHGVAERRRRRRYPAGPPGGLRAYRLENDDLGRPHHARSPAAESGVPRRQPRARRSARSALIGRPDAAASATSSRSAAGARR